MSVSRWAYIPDRCDGDACPGDCDLCSKAMDNVALMEDDSNTPNTLEALERILNYCEEIDLHLPEAERSGYRMLPDYETVRAALTERKRGRWIDLRQEGDSRFMCSVCKWKEHVPTCMGKPTVWEYCPSCGARMDGDGNG